MRDLLRDFAEHPRSVGETYLGHLATASRFAAAMLLGGLACLVHGLLPCFFQTTGSRQIRRLHQAMVTDRAHAHDVMRKPQRSESGSDWCWTI